MKRVARAHAGPAARVLAARQLPLRPDAAARARLRRLVAQGMQVAGPAYGLLLDAWGEEFLAHGAIELKFVGIVHRRRDRRGDGRARRRRRDASTVENITSGRTAVVGTRPTARDGDAHDDPRPPSLEHRLHLARPPGPVPRASRPSRPAAYDEQGFFVLEDAVDAGDARRARRRDRAVRPRGARLPRAPSPTAGSASPASTPSRSRIHLVDPLDGAARLLRVAAVRRPLPRPHRPRRRGSTGTRPCTSSRTAPSRCCGTRTTATRTSSRRRTSRAGSRSPTRRSRTAASGCCPACTAPAPSRTSTRRSGSSAARNPEGAVAVPVQAGSIVVFSSLTPARDGSQHHRRRAQGLHRPVRPRRRGRAPRRSRERLAHRPRPPGRPTTQFPLLVSGSTPRSSRRLVTVLFVLRLGNAAIGQESTMRGRGMVTLLIALAVVGAFALPPAATRTPGPRRVLPSATITVSYQDEAAAMLRAKGYQVLLAGFPGRSLLDVNMCKASEAHYWSNSFDPDVVVYQAIGTYGLLDGRRDPAVPAVGHAGVGPRSSASGRAPPSLNQRAFKAPARFLWILNPQTVPAKNTAALNAIYRDVALGKAGLIDGWTAFGGATFDPRWRIWDGVHLNQAGQTRLGQPRRRRDRLAARECRKPRANGPFAHEETARCVVVHAATGRSTLFTSRVEGTVGRSPTTGRSGGTMRATTSIRVGRRRVGRVAIIVLPIALAATAFGGAAPRSRRRGCRVHDRHSDDRPRPVPERRGHRLRRPGHHRPDRHPRGLGRAAELAGEHGAIGHPRPAEPDPLPAGRPLLGRLHAHPAQAERRHTGRGLARSPEVRAWTTSRSI